VESVLSSFIIPHTDVRIQDTDYREADACGGYHRGVLDRQREYNPSEEPAAPDETHCDALFST